MALENTDDCVKALRKAMKAAQKAKLPVVVTLDEYDQLARSSRDGKENEIALMRGLFAVLKAYPPRFMLATGIMPLLATELSGATNDLEVITHDIDFADAIGLPHDVVVDELRRIAAYYAKRDEKLASSGWEEDFVDEMTQFMKEYFNGFRFHMVKKGKEVPAMYNTQQSISFFAMLMKEGPRPSLEVLREAKLEHVADAKMRLRKLKALFGTGIDTHTQVGETGVCVWAVFLMPQLETSFSQTDPFHVLLKGVNQHLQQVTHVHACPACAQMHLQVIRDRGRKRCRGDEFRGPGEH